MSRPIYRTSESWPSWVVALLVLAGVGVSASIVSRPGGAGGALASSSGLFGILLAVGAGLAVVAGFYGLFGRFYLSLFPDRIEARFGRLGLLRRTIPLNAVTDVEAVRYHPIRDFGGWGIRFRGNRTAWTMRGNQAVKLVLGDGKEVYLGTDVPQRWKERIDAARLHQVEKE